jgi:hypothetical protein
VVYRVLSIVAGILFSLLLLVGGVCLVYTMSVPAVRSALSAATAAIEDAASGAMDSLGVDGSSALSWLTGGADASGALSGALGGLASLGSGSSLSASDFADAEQGEAYLAWKDLVGDPVGSVLSGSGVSRSVLEGVAGGSTSAAEVLADLSESELMTIKGNAASYAATAGSASVSAVLPSDVRSSMWEASTAAQSFASAVQNLVDSAVSVKGGNLAASASLVSNANSVVGALQTMDSCIAAAEAGLK